MLNTCSPSRIYEEVFSILETITLRCSTMNLDYLKRVLDEIESFNKYYMDTCYYGQSIDQDILSLLHIVKKGTESCIKCIEGDTSEDNINILKLVKLLTDLNKLLEKDAASLSEELDKKSDTGKEIKRLYLAGISDIIDNVNDESFKHILRVFWSGLEPDLRKAVESYAIRKKLVDLSLRIESLIEEGLTLEDLFLQLCKSEIGLLSREIEITIEKRKYSESLARIIGLLNRLITLIEITGHLGFSKTKRLVNEIDQLKRFEHILKYIDLRNIVDVLKDLKELLDKQYNALG